MYRELARYYDLVYAGKDYQKEASLLHAIASQEGRSEGRDLLDIGCGTGRHIEQLRRWYRCTGLDLSPAMLRVARQRLPGTKFIQGSMEELSLDARFDVITCLFGALGYTLTVPRMQRAVCLMAAHLRPGGVLLVAPWRSPTQWAPGRLHGRIGEGRGLVVARVSRSSTPKPGLSRLELHYLIARPEGITYAKESQDLGLFSDREVQGAFRAAGLRSHHLKEFAGSANGLHVGVKPAA